MKPIKFILYVAAAWCGILTFAHFRNIGIYQFSRWAVCAAAVFGAVNLKSDWRWALAVVAILFNPIIPIHFSRDTWQVLDGLSAAVFLMTTFRVQRVPNSQ